MYISKSTTSAVNALNNSKNAVWQKLFLALLVILLFGCNDQTAAPFLTVESDYVSFSSGQDTKTIPCSANATIEVLSSQPEWCVAKVVTLDNGSAIEISVTLHTDREQARTAFITVTAGAAKEVQIEVRQAASNVTFNVNVASVLQFVSQASQQQFTVSANVPYTVTSSDKSWCTVEYNSSLINNVTVTVTENEKIMERSTEIIIASPGFDEVVVPVLQEGYIEAKQGMTVKGWVHSNQTGIAGVVVSDGYAVTATDANGIYYLPSQKRNGYVFISIPGNYEPEAPDNIPQFFKWLRAGVNTEERADFELTAVDNDRHTVLAVTDWHLANRQNDLAQFPACLADMNGVIDSYQSAGTKTYALTMGDLTQDFDWYRSGFALPQFADILKWMNTCVFNTIGNHDHDPYFAGDWIAEQTYRSILGPNWYSFNLGKAHYVVLDNAVYINNGGSQGVTGDCTYTGRITTEQIDWLKKDLAFVADKSAPLVVAMHIHLYNPTNNAFVWSNGQEFIDCLAGFTNVHILTGHAHSNNKNVPYSGRLLIEHNFAPISASTWWTGNTGWSGNHICCDGSVGGFGVFEINDKNVEWYYKSVGYERNYQFRTYDRNCIHITAAKYAPNANATYAAKAAEFAGIWGIQHNGNEVYINVWGYDPSWKIEVTEGAVSLPVTNIRISDPLHIISYSFVRLNRNSDPDTPPTGHIFRVTAGSPTSTLNIKVTDRFGNVYTETMTRPKEFTYDMR